MARRKKTDLCAVHFPRGWDSAPAGARQVACEHGTWDAPKPAPRQRTGGAEDGGDAQDEQGA